MDVHGPGIVNQHAASGKSGTVATLSTEAELFANKRGHMRGDGRNFVNRGVGVSVVKVATVPS
jgi:hypothetical protein